MIERISIQLSEILTEVPDTIYQQISIFKKYYYYVQSCKEYDWVNECNTKNQSLKRDGAEGFDHLVSFSIPTYYLLFF